MGKPIQAGDLCEVISGLQGPNSPNIGLIVEVVAVIGEHSKLGHIWRCKADYAVRGQEGTDKVPLDHTDFAQAWLKKIEPPSTSKGTNTKKELTV